MEHAQSELEPDHAVLGPPITQNSDQHNRKQCVGVPLVKTIQEKFSCSWLIIGALCFVAPTPCLCRSLDTESNVFNRSLKQGLVLSSTEKGAWLLWRTRLMPLSRDCSVEGVRMTIFSTSFHHILAKPPTYKVWIMAFKLVQDHLRLQPSGS